MVSMVSRVYNKDMRYYKVGETELPSVTSIIGEMWPKKQLNAWIVRVGAREAGRISKETSSFGTACHTVRLHLSPPFCVSQHKTSTPVMSIVKWVAFSGFLCNHNTLTLYPRTTPEPAERTSQRSACHSGSGLSKSRIGPGLPHPHRSPSTT